MLFTVCRFFCVSVRRKCRRLCTGSCSERNRRCFAIAVALIGVLACIVVHSKRYEIIDYLDDRGWCQESKWQRFISELCRNYSKGLTMGPLCSQLCVTKELKYSRCLSHGIKIVIEMWTASGDVFILKSSEWAPNIGSEWQFGPHKLEDRKDFVVEMVTGALEDMIPGKRTRLAERFIAETLGGIPEDYNRTTLSVLQALLAQREFVFDFLFASSGIVPRLLGSCGHAYAVQSVPVISQLTDGLIMPSQSSWKERAAAGLAYLQFAQTLATEFSDWNMCDVQVGNFGLQRMGRNRFAAKAIDIDITFFNKELGVMLAQGENGPVCHHDNECNFYDCLGTCNRTTSLCSTRRSNSNLQAICRDILRGSFEGLKLQWSPRQIRPQLSSALSRCINGSQPDAVKAAREMEKILKAELAT